MVKLSKKRNAVKITVTFANSHAQFSSHQSTHRRHKPPGMTHRAGQVTHPHTRGQQTLSPGVVMLMFVQINWSLPLRLLPAICRWHHVTIWACLCTCRCSDTGSACPSPKSLKTHKTRVLSAVPLLAWQRNLENTQELLTRGVCDVRSMAFYHNLGSSTLSPPRGSKRLSCVSLWHGGGKNQCLSSISDHVFPNQVSGK